MTSFTNLIGSISEIEVAKHHTNYSVLDILLAVINTIWLSANKWIFERATVYDEHRPTVGRLRADYEFMRLLGLFMYARIMWRCEVTWSCDASTGCSNHSRNAYVSINGFRPFIRIGSTLSQIAKICVRDKQLFPWGIWVAATKQNVRVGTFVTFLIQTRHCDSRNAIQILILTAKICTYRNKSCFLEGIWVAAKKPERPCRNVCDTSKITTKLKHHWLNLHRAQLSPLFAVE